jgi:hypothetical protein
LSRAPLLTCARPDYAGNSRRKGDIPEVKIRQVKDKEQEVIVHHEAVHPPKEPSSIWGWYEEFAIKWSETFITKKRKDNPEG